MLCDIRGLIFLFLTTFSMLAFFFSAVTLGLVAGFYRVVKPPRESL